MEWLKAIWQGTSHLFFPHLCKACGVPLVADETVVCLACHHALPLVGKKYMVDNDAEMRLAGRFPFSHIASLAYYVKGGITQHLIEQLKYKQQQPIGEYLGKRLGRRISDAAWQSPVDIIVPLPLHPKRLARRGYNQAAIIATATANILNTPMVTDSLVRVKYTDSQVSTKSRVERLQNMEHAFVVKNHDALANKHVLLIDDVLTTGATIEAAANELLKVPNIQLSIATAGLAIQ